MCVSMAVYTHAHAHASGYLADVCGGAELRGSALLDASASATPRLPYTHTAQCSLRENRRRPTRPKDTRPPPPTPPTPPCLQGRCPRSTGPAVKPLITEVSGLLEDGLILKRWLIGVYGDLNQNDRNRTQDIKSQNLNTDTRQSITGPAKIRNKYAEKKHPKFGFPLRSYK